MLGIFKEENFRNIWGYGAVRGIVGKAASCCKRQIGSEQREDVW